MSKIRMIDIAKKVGVSSATVSRVIHNSGYVADDLRKKIEAAIAETGYTSNRISAKPAEHNKLIGYVSPRNNPNFFYDALNSAIIQEASSQGYRVIPLFIDEGQRLMSDNIQSYAEKLLAFSLAGLVIVGYIDNKLKAAPRQFLQQCGVPVVFIERADGCYGFNQVCIDNEMGTYISALHLIRAGHTHLAYIDYHLDGSVENARREGFLRAISESNSNDTQYVVVKCKETTASAGKIAMQAAYEKDPQITAVVAYYDVHAAGAMQYLSHVGKRIPDDIEVIGNDNMIAGLLTPPISSVQMPIGEIASAAIDMVVTHKDSTEDFYAKKVMLEPKLILR